MPYALIAESERLYAGLSDGAVLETSDARTTWHALPFRLHAIERSLIHIAAAWRRQPPKPSWGPVSPKTVTRPHVYEIATDARSLGEKTRVDGDVANTWC
jgi:hypothetical protein